MEERRSPNKAIVAVIIIVLLAAVIAGTVYVMNTRSSNDADSSLTTSSANDTQSSSESSSTPTTSESYKDGTYRATGSYSSPGGQEEVAVTVTLASGVIREVSVTTDPASGTSAQYQSEFKSNYKTMVVGKNISEVKLNRVAGSSLTSTGFNSALDKIKRDAA